LLHYLRRRIGAFFMTTLQKIENAGLERDRILVLNPWGARQITSVLNKEGYSQEISSGSRVKFIGFEFKGRFDTDRRARIRVTLNSRKGKTVLVRVHDGVDYFEPDILKKGE
jgi:hypothetical protein